jgi:GrpB-like predicted nucleotidyltransferase (UPF0157 family)
MPCQGCQRRKAAIVRQAVAFRRWLKKTPQQAKEAIVRRLRGRHGV